MEVTLTTFIANRKKVASSIKITQNQKMRDKVKRVVVIASN